MRENQAPGVQHPKLTKTDT